MLCIQNVSKNVGSCETCELLNLANDSLYETYSSSIINAGHRSVTGLLHMDEDFLQ